MTSFIKMAMRAVERNRAQKNLDYGVVSIRTRRNGNNII